MRMLEKLTILRFKSISEQALKLGPLNVFIGANGSGKSNLVGVFPFVRRLIEGELQISTGVAGGADRLLHFGRKQSRSLAVELEFGDADSANGYGFLLLPTEDGTDRFVFGAEEYWFHNRKKYPDPKKESLGNGHTESKLRSALDRVATHVFGDLYSYQLYHFHDTSSQAGMKQTCDLRDNHMLRADAANLAAILFLLQEKHPGHFRTIEDTIRQVAPFFAGFQLQPAKENPETIRLEWRHRGSDAYWNAGSLSDGTLRFICLATLLLKLKLPSLVFL